MNQNKILNLNKCNETINLHRQKGDKIVFTNGCFDILHIGHLSLLKQAKSFGDVLCVGVNSDESVRKLKGDDRPINNEKDRIELLTAFSIVDYIVVFNELTPCNTIATLKPDIHVKGGDYDPANFEHMPEAKIIKEYGGEIKIIKIIKGKSSSDIIKKIHP